MLPTAGYLVQRMARARRGAVAIGAARSRGAEGSRYVCSDTSTTPVMAAATPPFEAEYGP